MRHDKELIIFLRIDSVTVNRPKPHLIEINETFVIHAHQSVLHLNCSIIAETPVLLQSAPAPSQVNWTLLASVDHILAAPAVKEYVTHVVPHFVAHVHVSAHTYSTVHNPSLAKACQMEWSPVEMWKMALFRVRLYLWEKVQRPTDLQRHHNLCNLSSKCSISVVFQMNEENAALRYKIPLLPQKV